MNNENQIKEVKGWGRGTFIMYVLTCSLLWSPFSSLNVGNLFIALSFQSETNIGEDAKIGLVTLDSWEMKCCLFIDSPIYSYLRQLIMPAPVILTICITDSYLVCDCCSHTSPSPHWDMNYISAIWSNFFSHDYFHLQGIRCLHRSSMESKCQGFLNAFQSK